MSSQLTREVILGVDTHLDQHIGVVIDSVGKLLGHLSVTANSKGYKQLAKWARSFGDLQRAGIEGTGTYGAGLARYLAAEDVLVLEINRPDRSMRRFRGKSDPTDAESAARTVLSGTDCAVPKSQSGAAEAMRIISVARRSTVKSRTQTINQLRGLLISAPDEIRSRLWKSNAAECAKCCARLRSLGETNWSKTLATTLRLLAKRWLYLTEELKLLDKDLEQLTAKAATRVRKQFGVGPQTAAILLSVAGDNPERLRSESALASLCGVNPLEASSGKTVRHRLNRGGNRAANNALWTIAMVRMRSDPRTQVYVARRTAEGKSVKEIHRCLKRYIVRELYPLILADLEDAALTS
ncbi:IS110 family transposase [Desulfosediminicola ganghwensis]|uniref:IS110 family transposase n=1 Tax=Desulfosediminicola ganghwensis TaxID=2569540 RepID=UPI0010AD43BE|nr:IS110 family transposase [Desulfosediminicola ganghwensis]